VTDTATTAPRAGWYQDPAAAAPYRWWNGERWTTDTLDRLPTLPATSDPEAPSVAPSTTDSSLPSRRSLREQKPAAESGAGGGGETSTSAAPAPYIPLNPLGAAHSPSTPGTPESPSWHTPDAWVANAPQAPLHAVYGSGAPFAPQVRRMPVVRAINRPARNSLALGVLSMLILLCVIAVTIVTRELHAVWSLWALVGLIAGIVGLSRANRWEAAGMVPVGRGRAIAGIVLCAIALLGQTTEAGLVVAGSYGNASSSATGLTSQGSGSAPTPVIGTPRGDGTFTYSEGQAETAVAGAIKGSTSLQPVVRCPLSVPLSVGSSFICHVRLSANSAMLNAQVSVLDASGRSAVQVGVG
jgi:hypothetical protein